MAALIPLSNGGFARVDEGDYGWLNLHTWRWREHECGRKYVYTRVPSEQIGQREKQVAMHRLILSAPDGVEVDHKDGDSFNNQRNNLRLATHSQNMANRVWECHKKGKPKGVRQKREHSFEARLQVNGKYVQVGTFKTQEEAARAYDRAALKHFGEFARTNYPREEYGGEDGEGDSAE